MGPTVTRPYMLEARIHGLSAAHLIPFTMHLSSTNSNDPTATSSERPEKQFSTGSLRSPSRNFTTPFKIRRQFVKQIANTGVRIETSLESGSWRRRNSRNGRHENFRTYGITACVSIVMLIRKASPAILTTSCSWRRENCSGVGHFIIEVTCIGH